LTQWIYYNYISLPPPTIVHLPENAISSYDYPDLKDQYPHSDIRPVSIPRNYNHSPGSSRAEQSPLLTISDEALSPPYSASASPSKWYTLGDMTPQRTPSPRIILSAIFIFSLKTQASSTLTTTQPMHSAMLQIDHLLVGRIFAWLCAGLYLASRVPQILKNQQRKSVDGLSSALFIFAALGNLTYTTSILLSSAVRSRAKFVEAIPYLLGSIGTLVFDTIIFSQFIWYRQRRIDSVGA
jgi:solute carrier family 66 (lysosomal lysine-arginine transporter), member 1